MIMMIPMMMMDDDDEKTGKRCLQGMGHVLRMPNSILTGKVCSGWYREKEEEQERRLPYTNKYKINV